VRYRIDCIGDAIDPALHNMPMSQSEIKRKKNLSLSQPVSVYTANATISVANQLCCNAATIQGGRIAVRRPFPAESRALRAVHDIRFMTFGSYSMAQPPNVPQIVMKGMTTSSCLKVAPRKNSARPVRQDASPVEALAISWTP
jgi:hypothetical protein